MCVVNYWLPNAGSEEVTLVLGEQKLVVQSYHSAGEDITSTFLVHHKLKELCNLAANLAAVRGALHTSMTLDSTELDRLSLTVPQGVLQDEDGTLPVVEVTFSLKEVR
jgi:hypothetical protein